MKDWLRTDWRFDDHCRIFTIGVKPLAAKAILHCLRDISDHPDNGPEKLESVLLDLITKARPELAGCALWSMQFNHSRWQWEIGVSHGSLPACAPGCEIQKEALFSEETSGGNAGG